MGPARLERQWTGHTLGCGNEAGLQPVCRRRARCLGAEGQRDGVLCPHRPLGCRRAADSTTRAERAAHRRGFQQGSEASTQEALLVVQLWVVPEPQPQPKVTSALDLLM